MLACSPRCHCCHAEHGPYGTEHAYVLVTPDYKTMTAVTLLQGTALPKALTLGPGEVQGCMQGPHTNPTIQATWQVPVAEASGQVKLDKDAMHLSAK